MMGNMLLWATLFVFAISLFRFSYSYGGLARTFSGIDVVLLQQAIAVTDAKETSYTPYFVEQKVISLVETRFQEDLKPYLFGASYSTNYVFDRYRLNLKGNKSHPTCVTISLSTKSDFLSYYDSKTFNISLGDAYGR